MKTAPAKQERFSADICTLIDPVQIDPYTLIRGVCFIITVKNRRLYCCLLIVEEKKKASWLARPTPCYYCQSERHLLSENRFGRDMGTPTEL